MTGSFSSAFSFQQANASITQQYAGSCNVNCNNTIDNINISLIDTLLSGGINFTQQCSADANCLFQTTQNSLTDVLFKAQNSSTAAGGVLPGISVSETGTYQNINENILNSVSQTCSVGSYNDISNVDIFAQSSTIGGGINFSQQGSTQGSCTFNTIMTATDMATGTADNCSASGKMAKKTCGGKGGTIGSTLVYIGIGLVMFVGVMMLYRAFRGTPPKTPGTGVGNGSTASGISSKVGVSSGAASTTTSGAASVAASAVGK